MFYSFLGNDIKITGKWVAVHLAIPIHIIDEETNTNTISSFPLKIRAFCTSEKSINNNLNFLGLSPGPNNLIDYSFYHQFN